MSQGMNVVQQMQAQLAYMQRAHQQIGAENQQLKTDIAQMKGMLQALQSTQVSVQRGAAASAPVRRNGPMCKAWGGNGYVSLNDIPGRFIPYDFFVDIPIADGVTAEQSNTLYVTMDGPFVAVKRFAIFRSDLQFRYTDLEGDTTAYVGRTQGRFRPVTSSTDILDAVRAFEQLSQYQPSYVGAVYDSATPAIVPVANPAGIHGGATALYAQSTDVTNLLPNFPGTGRPLVVSPLSMASGRSMGFDGLVAVEVQGANYQRQNQRIPSALWVKGFNGPVPLSVEDVFEPGEVVVIKVTPTHVNNPSAGNIAGLVARNDVFTYAGAAGGAANNPLPVGSFPFLGGQYDGHEGIDDQTLDGDTAVTTDRVTRVANGILTIGFMGYKIVAPPMAL